MHPLLRPTQVIFEGVPTYPDASRCWEIVDRLGVTLFYTAPTAIRTLEGLGSKWLEGSRCDAEARTRCFQSIVRVLGARAAAASVARHAVCE